MIPASFLFYLLASIVAVTAAAAAAAITTAASVVVPAASAAGGATAGGLAPAVVLHGFFGRPAFQHGLAGEADLAALVDVGDHHGDLIAQLSTNLRPCSTRSESSWEMCTMPSMFGQDLDKSAEIGDADDLAGVDAPDLGGFGEGFDALARGGFVLAVDGGDEDSAVVVDIDLGAGFFLQGADHLAARADDGADLIDRDLDDGDARGVRLELGARGGDDFQHLVQDGQACFAGLLEGFCHDLGGDALDLDIHLQGGDAFARCRPP